jgi:hypothetical protein
LVWGTTSEQFAKGLIDSRDDLFHLLEPAGRILNDHPIQQAVHGLQFRSLEL